MTQDSINTQVTDLSGQVAPKKYLISEGWGHSFEGDGERACRFIYDTESEQIIYMDILRNFWRKAGQEAIADVQDSLKNANEDAFETPEDYGLLADNELPLWVVKSQLIIPYSTIKSEG